jgi:flagellar motor switch protein FliM
MATLTPSELAALLGPCAVPTAELSQAVSEVTTLRWTSFAEGFALRLTARLRPLIRAAARVTFGDARTLTAESLGLAHDSTAVMRFWQSSRSIEPLAVALSAPLAATFVDRLLGGRLTSNVEDSELHQPLTNVDARLASRLLDAVQQSASEAAETMAASDVTDAAAAPMSIAEAWLPDSVLVRLTFELRFVQGGGSLDLLLPLEIAESLADKPSDSPACPQFAHGSPAASPSANPAPRRVTVTAQFASTSLSRNDLESLAVGDVLLADPDSDSPLQVLVDGQPRFRAIPGTLDGRKAIRLVSSEFR